MNFKKFFIVLSAFLIVGFSNSTNKVSFAVCTNPAECDGAGSGNGGSGGGAACSPDKFMDLKMIDSHNTGLNLTTLIAYFTNTTNAPTFLGFGMSPTEAMSCVPYIIDQTELARIAPGFDAAIKAVGCPEVEAVICDSIINQYNTSTGTTSSGFRAFKDGKDFLKLSNSKVGGSLLGYVYLAQNVLETEAPPVNLAYFFNDYMAKIPVVGERAYAATQEVDYGHNLINSVLVLWKFFRNVAYALMSIIMLWSGFAIITRRKIAAQTVVSVQYALPKIVVALVMIALSYPIGAIITSFAWTVFNSAGDIVASISGGDLASMIDVNKILGIGGTIVLGMMLEILLAGSGAILIVIVLMAIILLFYAIFCYLKAVFIYLKMVVAIVVSPLVVAMYAIPGNDDVLMNWIKKMVAYCVGLFGMGLVLNLTYTFGLMLIIQTISPGSTAGNGASLANVSVSAQLVGASLFNIFLYPIVLIFGSALALKVPAMAEEAIVGKPKR